jgi:DNA-binding response OmpR family regulator
MARRILIVEDTDTAATTLEVALLTIPGVQVERVRDGLRALEYLARESGPPVDLLITDIEMPFLDGFELIGRLRRQKQFERLPILVVSGCNDPQTSARALRLGADAYFSKPWSPLTFRQTVEDFLKH